MHTSIYLDRYTRIEIASKAITKEASVVKPMDLVQFGQNRKATRRSGRIDASPNWNPINNMCIIYIYNVYIYM